MVSAVGGTPGNISYHTWGLGTGEVVATGNPKGVIDYHEKMGITATDVGQVADKPEITVMSGALNSRHHAEPLKLAYRYGESALG